MATTPEQSAGDEPVVSRESVTSLVQQLLYRALHVEKRSYAELSALSGLSPRRIESYATEGKEPSLSAALSLAVALGKPAVNAMLSKIGYSARQVGASDDAAPGLAVAEMLGSLRVIAEAAADGVIDHTEAPACDAAATNVIACASTFQRARGA